MIAETFAARQITDSESPTAETTWLAINDEDDTFADEVAAYAAVMAEAPTTYTFPSGRVAVLVNVQISDVTEEMWSFKLSYSTIEPKGEDDLEYEFETSTQDVTITHAFTTTAYTGGGRTAPDFEGGVNVSAKGEVQGVSNGQPSFAFTITKHWPASSINSSYQLILASLTGKYNDDEFLDFPAGTVKFLGARGRITGRSRPVIDGGKVWPITYRFQVNPNETGLTVGDITGIDKLGWQYLDVYRMTIADTSSKRKIEVPHSVYVHDLPPGPGDFSLLAL